MAHDSAAQGSRASSMSSFRSPSTPSYSGNLPHTQGYQSGSPPPPPWDNHRTRQPQEENIMQPPRRTTTTLLSPSPEPERTHLLAQAAADAAFHRSSRSPSPHEPQRTVVTITTRIREELQHIEDHNLVDRVLEDARASWYAYSTPTPIQAEDIDPYAFIQDFIGKDWKDHNRPPEGAVEISNKVLGGGWKCSTKHHACGDYYNAYARTWCFGCGKTRDTPVPIAEKDPAHRLAWDLPYTPDSKDPKELGWALFQKDTGWTPRTSGTKAKHGTKAKRYKTHNARSNALYKQLSKTNMAQAEIRNHIRRPFQFLKKGQRNEKDNKDQERVEDHNANEDPIYSDANEDSIISEDSEDSIDSETDFLIKFYRRRTNPPPVSSPAALVIVKDIEVPPQWKDQWKARISPIIAEELSSCDYTLKEAGFTTLQLEIALFLCMVQAKYPLNERFTGELKTDHVALQFAKEVIEGGQVKDIFHRMLAVAREERFKRVERFEAEESIGDHWTTLEGAFRVETQ